MLHFCGVFKEKIGLIGLCLFLNGCQIWDEAPPKKLDPVLGMTAQEATQSLLNPPVAPESSRRSFTPTPLSSLHVEPSETPPEFHKPVTLSLSGKVPLQDIFLQMARQVGVNISIDPDVQGTASFHAIRRPFKDVIQDLCTLNHLRYRMEKNMLRIEPDRPYLVTYNAQFLSMTRRNESRISVSTDIFTMKPKSDKALGGGDNSSTTFLTGESKNDFWGELEANLPLILRNSEGDKTGSKKDQPYYSLHKHGGIILVYGTQAQHAQVANFLRMLRLSISSQVLIEAKIVEVILKDEFKAGINWNWVKGNFALQAPLGDLAVPGSFSKSMTPLRDVFTIGGGGNQFTEMISLMHKYGQVRTLSSPRLTTLNNQPGVMKIVTSYVYFSLNYDREHGLDVLREHEHVSSEIHTVPIGLIMTVHPSINLTDGSIVLVLRPTISRVVDEKPDPAVSLISKEGVQSYVPVVRKQEFETVVCIPSGGFIVIGGLMEESSKNNRSAIPYLGDLPILGSLTSSQADDRIISEMVIFLKASIVDPETGQLVPFPLQEQTVKAADQNLYQTFTRDPRPLKLL